MEMQVTDATPTLIKRTVTEGGIAVLTFNDPDRRNALSPALREQLLQVLRDEAQSTESRAVVLTGEGSAFCAGGDISAMGMDPKLSSERMKILHDIARQLALFPKPMVAAVNGHAFGAGWSMSLLCDYVVTAPTAKHGATFGKLGLVPDTAFLWAACRRISQVKAMHLFMTAEILNADQVLALGLTDELSDNVVEAAIARAESFCGIGPLAFAAAKASLAEGPDGIEWYLQREFDDQARMYHSADHREAVAAFKGKRAPQFTGE